VLRREAIERQRIRERGDARGAFGAELEAQGRSHQEHTEIAEAPPPDDIASLLGIKSGTAALFRRRRMSADNVPVQLSTSWFPLDLAGGTQIAERDTGPGGSYSRLADLGHAPAEYTETVRVRPPAGDETAALQLDAEQRVFSIRRTAADAAGRVVEVNDMILPAHQWELVYRWSA
jgi:DNA-binding GntR family transcriptional regulator